MALRQACQGVGELGFQSGGRDLRGDDDECRVAHGLFDGVSCPRPVGDIQARVQVREHVRERLDDLGPAHAGDAGTHA